MIPALLQSGRLLIANPTLRDPNFSRTVILLCEHNDDGSMGLILNRPANYTIKEALTDIPSSATTQAPLYWGGPVETQTVLALFRDQEHQIDGRRVTEELALGNKLEDLIDLLGEPHKVEKCLRVFAGYAGWGVGQLDKEMSESSWILAPSSAKLIFDTPVENIWVRALEALGPSYAFLATMPENPRMN